MQGEDMNVTLMDAAQEWIKARGGTAAVDLLSYST